MEWVGSDKYTLINLDTDWLIYLETDEGDLVFFRRDQYGSCLKEVQSKSGKIQSKYLEDDDFIRVWVIGGGLRSDLKFVPYPFLWDLI